MERIKTFLRSQKLQNLLLIITIFVFIILIFRNCGRTQIDNKINQLEQNLIYYKDSLKVTVNKLNEIEYQRSVLVADKKSIKKLNSELTKEIQKERGKVIYLSKINSILNTKIDSIQNGINGTVDVVINTNGTQTISFTYDTIYSFGNERHIDGFIDVNFCKDKFIFQTYVTDNGDTVNFKIPYIDKDAVLVSLPKDSIVLTLITGLQQDKYSNNLEIFVRSEYPGFKVNKLDGALIDPQKSELIKSYFPRKKWGVGFILGGCTMIDKSGTVHFGPMIGCGITYDIISF